MPKVEPQGPWVVYLDAQGKAAAAGPGGPIEKLVTERRRVLALDLRGMGETAPSSRPGGIFGGEYTESFLALHLNRPLLGQRVYDLLSVLAALPEETRKEGIELIGTGPAGLIALHAAVLDERIKAVTLEQTLSSWSDVVKTPQAQRQLAARRPRRAGRLRSARSVRGARPAAADHPPAGRCPRRAALGRGRGPYVRLRSQRL